MTSQPDASSSIESQRVAAFVQRLRELTWIDGRNLAIEYRWAEGRDERYAEIAAEFVRLKVDVIVTVATPATLATKQATAVIPIVFVTASDPVGTGLVASLARPGGNVTGLANQISDTSGKKLEFLREVVPGLRRLAIMANVGNPASALDMGEAEATARTLGLEVITSEIRRAEDIAPAFEALKDRADALYLCPDPLMNTNRTRINISALGAHLPTVHGARDFVEAGGRHDGSAIQSKEQAIEQAEAGSQSGARGGKAGKGKEIRIVEHGRTLLQIQRGA